MDPCKSLTLRVNVARCWRNVLHQRSGHSSPAPEGNALRCPTSLKNKAEATLVRRQQVEAAPSTLLEEAASGFLSFAKAVRKHWPIAAASTLLAAAGGLVYAKSQPKVYQAATMLEINPHASQPLGQKTEGVMDLGATLFSDPREYFETQYKIITSARVLSGAVRDVSLTTDYSFFDYRSPPAQPISVEAAVARLRRNTTVVIPSSAAGWS